MALAIPHAGIDFDSLRPMSNSVESLAPGKFTESGSHQLHYRLSGSGAPTIICEAGLGCGSETWCAIRDLLAESMSVLSYDRAGLMYSQPRGDPLTIEAVVSDLRSLIDHTRPPQPYIFVGHSYGGVLIRHFAERFPELVDAIVFVESVQPEHLQQLPLIRALFRTKGFLVRLARFAKSKPRMTKVLFRLGAPIVWLSSALKYRRYTTRYGSEIIDAVRTQPLITLCATAAEVETLQYFISTVPRQLRRELPITVIASGQPLSKRQFPGSSAENLARYASIHQQLQKDLTTLSPQATFVLDNESSHNVPVDNPDLLIREIKKIADRLMTL